MCEEIFFKHKQTKDEQYQTRHELITIAHCQKVFLCYNSQLFKGLNDSLRQEVTIMNENFSVSVLAVSTKLFSASLMVGLTLIYAFDNIF